jgi:SAM-dependent methyltransferase
MDQKLRQILVCPKCKGDLAEQETEGHRELTCASCSLTYTVKDGVPRFVPIENYAGSFGFQWNRFRREQLDSFNNTTLSADRFWSETGWTADDMRGALVLDVGCGAGRFLDAASATDATIVGVDLSSAIDAAKDNLSGRSNVHFVQASIYDLPFRPGTFDKVYCIGVIQHTPDTVKSLKCIADMVRPGGDFAVTIYPRKPWTKLFSKYWFRPITRRMSKEKLLGAIEKIMPIAFPVTSVLFRVPLLGRVFRFVIPIANYVEERQLSDQQRYAWAVLDTFDMLSPYYDQPMTEVEARKPLLESGIEVTRHTYYGLNLVGKRSSM